MGRPLYTSILLARDAIKATQPEPPKPVYPLVEKWSRWNAFDPDSDEFFEADNVVEERFLSEEEVAERAQAQHRETTRLLAERLLREANNSTTSLSMSEESERAAAAQMMDIETTPLVATRSPSPHETRSRENVQASVGPPAEVQPPRRQPRRAPAIVEWRLSTTGEISPAPTDVAIPRISVVPAALRETELTLSRSPSPDPLAILSGLQYLSDSPRPLIPVESPPRPISPIPNTPARISGIFETPPSTGRTLTAVSPTPTMTPRIISWSDVEPRRTPASPNPRDATLFLGSRSLPLTY